MANEVTKDFVFYKYIKEFPTAASFRLAQIYGISEYEALQKITKVIKDIESEVGE